MSDPCFYVERPSGGRKLPVLISCPHTGTEIPKDLAQGMTAAGRATPDTDWRVHELYDFAPAAGITLIRARYSRFVVDLNRDPEGKKLYADGRAETGLVPFKTFGQHAIYEAGAEPAAPQIAARVKAYYDPYHAEVAALLAALKAEHGGPVLFYEAHSIKRYVPSIQEDEFPDLMLGDQQGRTAAARLAAVALVRLADAGYDVSHNAPFMGGYLTRKFGKPETGVHALQLEMSQDVYLDDEDSPAPRLDPDKIARLQPVLRTTLIALAEALGALK